MIENKEEKKQAAASYILTFYNQVLALNDIYARYVNLLTELKAKYNEAAIVENKIDESEKQLLLEVVRNARYVVATSQIQYRILAETLKITNVDDKLYNKIKDNFIIKLEDLQAYVYELNKFLLTNIIEELLSSSNEFISNVYKQNASK